MGLTETNRMGDIMENDPSHAVCLVFIPHGSIAGLVKEILESFPFLPGYAHLEADARLAAVILDKALRGAGEIEMQKVEVLQPVFYRLKGAYIIGRILLPDRYLPLVFCLRSGARGGSGWTRSCWMRTKSASYSASPVLTSMWSRSIPETW
jgi:isocitrate dehydrogenase kinase/phosphatase